MPTSPRTTDPAVIEHRLLDLAYTTDTRLTAPALAFYAPCSIEDAAKVLDRLVAEERLRLDVDNDGELRYSLPNRERVLLIRAPQLVIAPAHPPNAALAGLLSVPVPGAGHLYAGRPFAALVWFVVVALGYFVLVMPGFMLHVLCIASAANAAHHPRVPTTL